MDLKVALLWLVFLVIAAAVLRDVIVRFFPVRRTIGRPWLARRDWRAGVVRWDPNSRLLPTVLTSLGAVALGAVMYVATDFDRSAAIIIALGILFSVVSLGMTYRKLGNVGTATFTFDRFPFILGSRVTGTVRIARGDEIGRVRLALACFHGAENTFNFDYTEGDPPWSAHSGVEPQHRRQIHGALELDVDLDLPADQFPTVSGALRRVSWELSVWEARMNADPLVAFRIPVYGPDAAPFVQETAVGRAKKRSLQRSLSVFD